MSLSAEFYASACLFRADVEPEGVIVGSFDPDSGHERDVFVPGQCYWIIPVVHGDDAPRGINGAEGHLVILSVGLDLGGCFRYLP